MTDHLTPGTRVYVLHEDSLGTVDAAWVCTDEDGFAEGVLVTIDRDGEVVQAAREQLRSPTPDEDLDKRLPEYTREALANLTDEDLVAVLASAHAEATVRGRVDTIPVHDPNDPEAREPAPATDWDDEALVEHRATTAERHDAERG